MNCCLGIQHTYYTLRYEVVKLFHDVGISRIDIKSASWFVSK